MNVGFDLWCMKCRPDGSKGQPLQHFESLNLEALYFVGHTLCNTYSLVVPSTPYHDCAFCFVIVEMCMYAYVGSRFTGSQFYSNNFVKLL